MKPKVIEGRVIGNINDPVRDKQLKEELKKGEEEDATKQ
jgi:hypothetical protein